MTNSLNFTVSGIPKPQGSKKGFPIRRANGTLGVAMTESAGQPLTNWRQDVRAAAIAAADQQGWQTPTGAIGVAITFVLPRPKGHWGTGRNADKLKASARRLPTTKPDLDKLVRAVNDALASAGVIGDDAQIAVLSSRKVYAVTPQTPSGAQIAIEKFEEN